MSSVVSPSLLRWIPGCPFPLWSAPLPLDGTWELCVLCVLCGQPLTPQIDPGTSFSSVVGPTALRWILGPPFPLVLGPSPLRWILGPPFPLVLGPSPLRWILGPPFPLVVSPSPLRWILEPPFPL